MATGNRGRASDDPCTVEHDRYVELASASVDGEVTGDEQAVLDGHLATCAPCRRFVDEADRLRRRSRLRSLPDGARSPDPAPLIAELRRNDPRAVRSLVHRAWASGVLAACLLLVVGVVVTRHPAPTRPQEVSTATRAVTTGDDTFTQDRVTVPVGTTVEWSNAGRHRHLLVQEGDHATVRTALAPGGVEDVTFHEAGVYLVHCLLHPEMATTLTVAS